MLEFKPASVLCVHYDLSTSFRTALKTHPFQKSFLHSQLSLCLRCSWYVCACCVVCVCTCVCVKCLALPLKVEDRALHKSSLYYYYLQAILSQFLRAMDESHLPYVSTQWALGRKHIFFRYSQILSVQGHCFPTGFYTSCFGKLVHLISLVMFLSLKG